jgi:transposase
MGGREGIGRRPLTGEAFAATVRGTLGAEVEIAKRTELHRFVVMPKRWVVERSCVAGEMPASTEELRAQTRNQLAIHRAGICSFVAQKILNRL